MLMAPSPRRWQFNVRRFGLALVQRELTRFRFDPRQELGVSGLTVLEALNGSNEIIVMRGQPADLIASVLIRPCRPDETRLIRPTFFIGGKDDHRRVDDGSSTRICDCARQACALVGQDDLHTRNRLPRYEIEWRIGDVLTVEENLLDR